MLITPKNGKILPMSKKYAQRGVVESLPQNTNKPSLFERIRIPSAVVLAVGYLAISSSAGSSPRTARMEGFGFTTGMGQLEDAQDMKAAGANTVMFSFPYTAGGAEIKNDTADVCAAAQEAEEEGLDLVIRTESHQRIDRQLGYMATSASELRKYYTADYDLLSNLVGENGCAKGLDKIYLSPFNEANNQRFNRNQYVNGQWVAPRNLVHLYSYLYPRLHAAADNLGVKLEIIGGELKQHGQVKFMNQMHEVMKAENIKGPIFDIYAGHYYLNGTDAVPNISADQDIDKVMSAVKENFGNDTPVWFTEFGAISKTPLQMKTFYKGELPASLNPVSLIDQAKFDNDFIYSAACKGVDAVFAFQFKDDGTNMRTAPIFADGKTRKPSYYALKDAGNKALAGTITCPAAQ